MRLSATPLGAALLAVLLWPAAARAQEVIDQQNDPSTTSSFSCGTPPILNASIHQSFVPAQDNLSAVELRLRAGTSFPGAGLTSTIRIRAGGPTGEVLATSSADVAGPLSNQTQVVVRFEFDALALTPGNTYVIEWDTPNSVELSWMGSSGDPYPAGTAFTCAATAWPGGATDFNFTTYAEPAEESPCDAIEKLAGMVSATVPDRKQDCLQWRLALACKFVEKERPRLAIHQLHVFQAKVGVLLWWRCIDRDDAKAMLEAAHEVKNDLRGSLPKKKRCYHRRRRR